MAGVEGRESRAGCISVLLIPLMEWTTGGNAFVPHSEACQDPGTHTMLCTNTCVLQTIRIGGRKESPPADSR